MTELFGGQIHTDTFMIQFFCFASDTLWAAVGWQRRAEKCRRHLPGQLQTWLFPLHILQSSIKSAEGQRCEWLNSKLLPLQSVSCLLVLPILSAVISQSFNTVIRLVYFIILFVKRVTICMCLVRDEAIHLHPFCFLVLALFLPLFLFTMTVCSDVHYL